MPDLSSFKGTRPYASEMTGLYQPLLGWRSALQHQRVEEGLRSTASRSLLAIMPALQPNVALSAAPHALEATFHVAPATARPDGAQTISPVLDSRIARRVVALSTTGEGTAAGSVPLPGPVDVDRLRRYSSPEALQQLLDEDQQGLREEITEQVQRALEHADPARPPDPTAIVRRALARESVAAGALAHLSRTVEDRHLIGLVLGAPASSHLDGMSWLTDQVGAGAGADVTTAVISPIGVVHLFRHYYFELGSFLGTPVQHVWLAPGSTVEMVEVTTRRALVDRLTEQSRTVVDRSESSMRMQDELAETIRSEASQSTKFGVSASSSTSYNAVFVSGKVDVNASCDFEASQKEAREDTHKVSREQTEKLSTEMTRSLKTVVRTVTESTDLHSRRHTLTNPSTTELINYELRRKMHQVGVQVQDAGSSLCWQAYVDDPGAQLRLSTLVHVPEPTDLSHLNDPDEVPTPSPYSDQPFPVAFTWKSEHRSWTGGLLPIVSKLVVPKPGYVLRGADVRVVKGDNWGFTVWPPGPASAGFANVAYQKDYETQPPPNPIYLEKVDIPAPPPPAVPIPQSPTTEVSVQRVWVALQVSDGFKDDRQYDFNLEVTLHYQPSQMLLEQSRKRAEAAAELASAERAQAITEARFNALRQRVRAAASVPPRPFSDLRAEERTVVYRALISQLMSIAGVGSQANSRLRHVFAEAAWSRSSTSTGCSTSSPPNGGCRAPSPRRPGGSRAWTCRPWGTRR